MADQGADVHAVVDVVVPTYEHRDLVLELLATLNDLSVAARIVVDDVSSDDTVGVVRAQAPDATVVPLDEHHGLSFALNAGISAGSAPYVLFLNDDVLPCPGAVDRLVLALEAAPDASMAGGRLVDPDVARTQRRYTPRPIPTAATIVARVSGVERFWRDNPWSGRHLRRPLPEDRVTRSQRQPAGACLMVRRRDLESLGGWDERYCFWYEDVDLAARLLRSGPALYEPAAVFRHVGRQSTRSWQKPAQHARLYHGTLVFSATHLRSPGRLVAVYAVLLACLLRVPLYILRRDRDATSVYVDLMRQAVRVLARRPVGRSSGIAPRTRGSTATAVLSGQPDRQVSESAQARRSPSGIPPKA